MKKIILMFTLLFVLSGCMEEVNVNATVVAHAITSDKMGDRTYITVIKTDDKYVQELTGIKYYDIPVGKTFSVKVFRPKK